MRRNIKKNRFSKIILVGGLLVLFLPLFFLKSFAGVVTGGALYILRPLILSENKIEFFLHDNLAVLKGKKNLQEEADRLRQEIDFLEAQKIFSQSILEENRQLKSQLSFDSKNKLMAASVLAHPGFGGSNALIIDSGSLDGVQQGMPVVAFGNILLGFVSDVSSRISKVKLVSLPENETNVYVNNISAIAVGSGGENMEISLPRDIQVRPGDFVTSLGLEGLLLGIVERITQQPSDPFQKILFRLPINIQQLKQVYLIKN